jgi:hypothetical protein
MAAPAGAPDLGLACTTVEVAACSGNPDIKIYKGTGCTPAPPGGEPVYMTYQPVSSSHGCAKAPGCQSDGTTYPDPTTCTSWVTVGSGSPVPESCTCGPAPLHIGLADVNCATLKGTTTGYYGGRTGFELDENDCELQNQTVTDADDYWDSFGKSGGYGGPVGGTEWRPTVVPFGFVANNNVEHYVCVEPEPADYTAGAELAYDRYGWQCDPDFVNDEGKLVDCLSFYKCIDTDGDGDGYCADGTPAAEGECAEAEDCPVELTSACELRPLDNVSRLMVIHIFSDAVYNWSDFGKAFPSNTIVKCARHGGSGTHQTLLDQVFRGVAPFKTETQYPVNRDEGYPIVIGGTPGACDTLPAGGDGVAKNDGSYFWHYKSSSDLTRDCIDFYDGGIGYVDADKAMKTNKIKNGIHQLKYQGVAPTRRNVAGGKYNYWATQVAFADTAAGTGCVTGDLKTLADGLMAYAQKETLMTFANVGISAGFWATQGEMKVEKNPNDLAYPPRK